MVSTARFGPVDVPGGCFMVRGVFGAAGLLVDQCQKQHADNAHWLAQASVTEWKNVIRESPRMFASWPTLEGLLSKTARGATRDGLERDNRRCSAPPLDRAKGGPKL